MLELTADEFHQWDETFEVSFGLSPSQRNRVC